MKCEICGKDILKDSQCIDYKYYHNECIINLTKENQELKKQLENKYSRTGTLTNEVLYEENTKLINQQKVFIDYLENEIKKIQEQIKNYDIWHEVGTDINFLILKKQFNIEILSKYKEIIGGKDE